MSATNRRLIWANALAAAGVAAAGTSPWWLSPMTGASPPMRLLLVAVVTIAAWLGGLGPGLLATATGLWAIVLANDRPDDARELVNRLLRFGSLALLIDVLFAGVHARRRRAERRERERDRAERSLREAESLLRSFYESSASAMGVLELDGDDARIASANAPTARLFGREPGAVEGRALRELGLPPDRMADWMGHLRRCRETGRPVRFEGRGDWPGGPEWLATTLSAMDAPGGDLCSFLMEDITEDRRREEELRLAKEQAEAASRAKDRFLAVLSHELRTPLTPAMLAVSSLIESGADPATRPALEMIRRNIELESRLIDDLLDLSRIARGRLRLDRDVVDVHEAIRRAVEICLDETFAAGLGVVTELGASEHHAPGDRARVVQIAWNLIRNAAKFTPAGGRLTIRTSNAPGDGEGAADRLVVDFADTGMGIAPEVLPRSSRRSSRARTSVAGGRAGWGWAWRSAGRWPRRWAGGSRRPAPAPGSARPSAWSWRPSRPPRRRRRPTGRPRPGGRRWRPGPPAGPGCTS